MSHLFHMYTEPTPRNATPCAKGTVPYFLYSGDNKAATAFCYKPHVDRRNTTVKKLRG